MTPQAPTTIGPNLGQMTIQERSALNWEQKCDEWVGRYTAEAKSLARHYFGNEADFVLAAKAIPESYARRHRVFPWQRIVIEIDENLLLYKPATKTVQSHFDLLDPCPCQRGLRTIFPIFDIGGLEQARTFDWDEIVCDSCRDDRTAAFERALAGIAKR